VGEDLTFGLVDPLWPNASSLRVVAAVGAMATALTGEAPKGRDRRVAAARPLPAVAAAVACGPGVQPASSEQAGTAADPVPQGPAAVEAVAVTTAVGAVDRMLGVVAAVVVARGTESSGRSSPQASTVETGKWKSATDEVRSRGASTVMLTTSGGCTLQVHTVAEVALPSKACASSWERKEMRMTTARER